MLRDHEMPIFSDTAGSIDAILNDSKKGAMELAAVILQDPNLTAKLLKMSNTIYYNPSRQKMITVSRAIVVLGFKVIRELTLACSFFESILSPTNKQRANEEIAQAIHAAVQAKAIAIAANDPSPEEVFIAALLHNIGSISFWCFSNEEGERIQMLMANESYTKEQAEKEVLDFKLSELGVSLSNAWNLGGLIKESIHKTKSNKNARVQQVRLGYEVIEALKEGDSSNKMETCLKKIASITGQPIPILKQQIRTSTDVAATLADHFGAHEASICIQQEHHSAPVSEAVTTPTYDKKQLQFQIIQDIGALLSGKIDINVLLEMVLEGIQRGIGMDRTIFSLLTTNKKNLIEKISLGWRKNSYAQKIKFNISTSPKNVFASGLDNRQGLWLDAVADAALYIASDIDIIGKNACFLMPVCANNQVIGLIYCDRVLHQQPLNEDDFNVFKYFVQQANIALTLYRIQH
ncbi:MAG: GAF domain-containing protein [Gammaproteobacteria bacterium HGW-Gammaproteobacteria-3]|nr:MAG: GAF domain-containing protein [Gammaproteobacteria bacterium HGW-Gammaproteobacteria-3]